MIIYYRVQFVTEWIKKNAVTFQIFGFNVEKFASQKASLGDDNLGNLPASVPVRLTGGVKVAVSDWVSLL